jgi:hypothetical protein
MTDTRQTPWDQFLEDAGRVLGCITTPPRARVSGVESLCDELGPFREAAEAVADAIEHHTGPLTRLLTLMCGEPVTVDLAADGGGDPAGAVWRPNIREMKPFEYHTLDAPPGSRCWQRDGQLVMVSGLAAAVSRAVVISKRLRPSSLVRLGYFRVGRSIPTEPLGLVLEDCPGFWREQHKPEVISTLKGYAVVSRAVLHTDGLPVALVYEQLPPGFVALAYSRFDLWAAA